MTSNSIRICAFWARKLQPDRTKAKNLALISAQTMDKLNESDPVVAGIITKRVSNIDTKRLWTYLKPNFVLPDIDNISESAATMHCLSSDELDVLLLCDGLGYDITQVGTLLDIERIQESYLLAFHHLHSLIEFEDNIDIDKQRQVTLSVISNMCNDIRQFAPKPHTAKPKTFKAWTIKNNSQKRTASLNPELKRNILSSICIFTVIDIVAILIVIGILTLANDPNLSNSQRSWVSYSFENSVDNIRNGMYYVLEYLPDGYYKSTHTISPLSARTVYTNDTGEQILFTQQVSEKKLTGFDNAIDYSLLMINNRNTALCINDQQITLYWYSDCYAYSLMGTVSEDEMIKMATGIKFEPSNLPLKYNEFFAAEKGDIIVDNVVDTNIEKINNFYSNYMKGAYDCMRICDVTDDSVVIFTIETNNGKVYYTKDARRSNYGEQIFENGMLFNEMLIEEARGGKQSLILRSNGQQLSLIDF